ncbi:STAS domain-containing protein [Streptacidiphilus monticola]
MTLAIPAEQTCGLSSRTAAPGPAEVAECATVVVAGELDLAAAEPLRTRLSSAPAGHREVVADLSAVPFMDCSGLRPCWTPTATQPGSATA